MESDRYQPQQRPMPKKPAKFTKTDIKRLCDGAQEAGADRVEVMLDACRLVIPLDGNTEAPVTAPPTSDRAGVPETPEELRKLL
jgi:hypothetical protein